VDVLVVGGGPAGLAAAIELGRRDRRVVVVDRGVPIGEPDVLLTPRTVVAARRLGVELSESFHTVERIRLSSFETDQSIAVEWPTTRDISDPGVIAPRDAFVEQLVDLARSVGVQILAGCEALAPIIDRGFVRGASVRDHAARVREVRAAYTVVADGPNSTFGRLLGTFREPTWPFAVAEAAGFESPHDNAPEIEIVLGLTDRIGTPVVGYGWMFPTGSRSVSVGIVLNSTSPSFQVTNPVHLLERFVERRRTHWQLGDEPLRRAAGGRIPMGASVGPLAGPTYLIIGDAAGAANPLTGMGIETALETGIMAGDVIGEAFDEDSATVLQQYPKLIDDRFGSYYKTGRLTARLLGQPAAATKVFEAMTTRRSVADGALRIATQHLRGARGGRPEFVYRLARTISTFAPDA
jgi:flavin-dependent dehydrogenase